MLAQSAFYQAVYESRGSEVDPQARAAVELARVADDPRVLHGTLSTRGLVLLGSPDVAARAANLRELEAVEALQPSPAFRHFVRIEVLRERVVLALQQGDAQASERAADEFREQHGRRQGGHLSEFVPMWTGMFHLMAGRLDDAEQTIAVLGTSRDLNFINSWAAQFFTLRPNRARPRSSKQPSRLRPTPVRASSRCEPCTSWPARPLATTPARVKRSTRSPPTISPAIPPDSTLPASLANLTEVCTELGDRDAAAALSEHLLPYSGQLLVVSWGAICLGAADRFLAMLDMVLGRYDRAEERFARALALEEGAGADALTTRTRLAWAASTRTDPSDVEGAKELLDIAAETAARPRPCRAVRGDRSARAERNAQSLCFLHGTMVTRVEDELAAAIDALVAAGVVASRSEAVRIGLQQLVDRHRRARSVPGSLRGIGISPRPSRRSAGPTRRAHA